ncbi:MAG TPA: hypothetical protein PKA31_00050 [Candidatus Moranbacteria bacterium]|nr:hypothetical protein [Candidatus Moranbacteria bacterium]
MGIGHGSYCCAILADRKLALEVHFKLNANNPMRSLREAYCHFLRIWLAQKYLGRPSEINLIFKGPDGEDYFLSEYGQGVSMNKRRFRINGAVMANASCLTEKLLKAISFMDVFWENYRTEERRS